ncbi:MAG: hypothetical protein EP332_14205 [Bacteroidetes bacterium]|nr:MAG: hypothetical protein EP332_14205 [Bacteroidota bacterium]
MKYLLITCVALLMLGCKKDDPIQPPATSDLIVLRVTADSNNTTYRFDGAKTYQVNQSSGNFDSLPLFIEKEIKGDFGTATIHWQPDLTPVLKVTQNFLSIQQFIVPTSFDSVQGYAKAANPASLPSESRFQTVDWHLPNPPDYAAIWPAIADLEVVQKHVASNKKIGVYYFFISPVQGEQKWSWLIFLENN